MKDDLRCVEGRLYRHDPQGDDPYLETDIGQCPDCGGEGCEEVALSRQPAPPASEVGALCGRLKQLLAKATKGPWALLPATFSPRIYVTRREPSSDEPCVAEVIDRANAALIVEAVNALPTLLESLSRNGEVERLRGLLEESAQIFRREEEGARRNINSYAAEPLMQEVLDATAKRNANLVARIDAALDPEQRS